MNINIMIERKDEECDSLKLESRLLFILLLLLHHHHHHHPRNQVFEHARCLFRIWGDSIISSLWPSKFRK
jgi:hypothetical protein